MTSIKPQPLYLAALFVLLALLSGCGQEDTNSAAVETIEQSATIEAGENQASPGSAVEATPENQPEGDVFTVDPNGVTLVGAGLSRNGILNQLVEFDEAVLHGGPLIDQPVDVRVENGSIGEVLGQLLAGVDYQARFERQQGARDRLHSLWLGEAVMQANVVVQQIGLDGESELASPLVTEDGSIDAGEDYVKVLYQQYLDGDSDARKMAIMDVELTEGGVAFLDSVLKTAQDREVLVEAIRRLEIGEEFGAKWALLAALQHPDPVIVLEVLESIEVWRDPTVKKYIQPLTFHENVDVREKALELVDDLNTYAEVGVTADPYNIESATRAPLSPEQREQRKEVRKEKQRELRKEYEKLHDKAKQEQTQ